MEFALQILFWFEFWLNLCTINHLFRFKCRVLSLCSFHALSKEKSSFQKFFFQKFSNFVTIVSNWFLVESVHNKPMLWILKSNEGSMVMCTEIEDSRSACLLPLIRFMIWGPGLDLHFSSNSLFFFNFVFSKNYFCEFAVWMPIYLLLLFHF